MKKFTALFISVLLALSFAGCGSSGNKNENTEKECCMTSATEKECCRTSVTEDNIPDCCGA